MKTLKLIFTYAFYLQIKILSFSIHYKLKIFN